jgi:uncharacterized cupin superfamily protein
MSDHKLLLRAAEAAKSEKPFHHPWNPNSQMRGIQLAAAVGMTRTGVNLVRLPPGKESFVYHSHVTEEEWMYVLAGHGVAEIDGGTYEIGPGDFVGFPTPSVAHQVRNTTDEELVYLSGGERNELEIADFPKLNKRTLRRGDKIEVYALDSGKPFP